MESKLFFPDLCPSSFLTIEQQLFAIRIEFVISIKEDDLFLSWLYYMS